MKALTVAALASLYTVVDAADSEQKPCTAHSCGRQYDLNPLSSDSTDYVFSSHSGRNFTINVCRNVVSDLWNPRVDRPQDIGGFTRGAHGDISIGQVNSTVQVRDMHPVLYLMDGSSCPNAENLKASSAIRFICDTSIEKGHPQLVAQLPPEDDDACAFFIEWKTKYACPVPDRYAYWKTAVMVIVILLALSLTVIALLALHKLLKRRRALNADTYATPPLPHLAGPRTWSAALAERARDAKRLLTGQDPWGHPNGVAGTGPNPSPNANGRGGGRRWRPSFGWTRKNRNFTRLPGSAEEEAMMGSGGGGPFSVDDDDSDDDEHRSANRTVNGGDFAAEESAAWGAARPGGMNGAGVIRL